jgi:hypothetical protein
LQSYFAVNNYYTTRHVDVKLEHEPGSHLFYNAYLGYRVNDFPARVTLTDFDGYREDHIWRGEAGVGYKFLDTLRAEVRFRRDRRDSNFDRAAYGSSRIALQVSFGWF